MDINTIKQRLGVLEKYRREYWIDNNPTITDYHYSLYLDKLTNEINDLPESNDKITFLNVIKQIEFVDFNSLEKIRRENPLLSVPNKFDYDSIKKWMLKYSRTKNEEFLVMLKYDGLTIEKDFDLYLTRGSNDGFTGINVSHIKPIVDIVTDRKNINYFRGELLVLKDDVTDEFANSRSMVQGIVGRKNIDDVKVRLKLVDFEYHSITLSLKDFTEEKFNQIIVDFEKYDNYPSDGLVFKIKDEKYFNSLGRNNKHPYGICCYKYDDEQYESELIDITLTIGKERLTPVSTIKPVEIDGSIIEHPTMHNAKGIYDNNICIGDKVLVCKKAGVSPQISKYERTYKSKQQYKPKYCPCELKSDVIYKEPHYYCTNDLCPGKKIKKIMACVKLLNIKELGESTVISLIEKYEINDIIDILKLTEFQIRQLNGFSNISTNNLIKEFNNTLKSIKDYEILSCLNIPSIGIYIFKDICNNFTMKQIIQSPIESFEKIDGIGTDRATLIYNGIRNNVINIKKFYENFNKVIQTKGVSDDIKYICFTGKFSKPKSIYENIAISKGFNPVKSISRKVLLLVSDGKESSKVTKARQYNIKIITLSEFMNL